MYIKNTSQTPSVHTLCTTVGGQTATFTYSLTQAGTYSTAVPAVQNVGIYTLYYKVNAAYHNEASGSTPFEVISSDVAVPTANSGLVYNGSVQTGVNEGTGYTISGNTATNAGTYHATASLADSTNTKWATGAAKSDKDIEWTIAKASVEIPVGASFAYDGNIHIGVTASSMYSVSGDVASSAIGTHTVTVTLYDGDNYQWSDGTSAPKTITWNITSGSLMTFRSFSMPVLLANSEAANLAAEEYMTDRPESYNQSAGVDLEKANPYLPLVNKTDIIRAVDFEECEIEYDADTSTWTIDSEKELLLLSFLVNTGAAAAYSNRGSLSTISGYRAYKRGEIPWMLRYFMTGTATWNSTMLQKLYTSTGTFKLAEKTGGYRLDTCSFVSAVADTSLSSNQNVTFYIKDVFRGIGVSLTHHNLNYELGTLDTNGRQFGANFDGNNQTVRVNINTEWAARQTGLFGYIYGSGTIKNLTVSGSVTGNSYSGGVAGYSNNRAYRFENITVTDMTVNGKYSGGVIGGIGCSSFTSDYDSFKDIIVVSSSILAEKHKSGEEGTYAAGGLIGYCEATSMRISNVLIGISSSANSESIASTTTVKSYITKSSATVTSAYAGGLMGLVRPSAHTYSPQNGWWQVESSAISHVNVEAYKAGGLIGGYLSTGYGARYTYESSFKEIDATENVVKGYSSSTAGSVIGYAEKTIYNNVYYLHLGIYGVNVYTTGTDVLSANGSAVTPKTRYSGEYSYKTVEYGYISSFVNFNFIRYTDISRAMLTGVSNVPDSYKTDSDKKITASPTDLAQDGRLLTNTNTVSHTENGQTVIDSEPHIMMYPEGSTIYRASDNTTTDASTDDIMYFFYDSEQGTQTSLNEYVETLLEVVTATGSLDSNDNLNKVKRTGQTLAVVPENTLGAAENISYSTKKAVLEAGNVINISKSKGNLIYTNGTGFRGRGTDPDNVWSILTVSIRISYVHSPYPVVITLEIPIKIALQISVATQSWVAEGDRSADQASLAEIITSVGQYSTISSYENARDYVLRSLGYGRYNGKNQELLINNDGVYTSYVEVAYSGDRLLIDTRVSVPQNAAGDDLLDSDGVPYYFYETDSTNQIVYYGNSKYMQYVNYTQEIDPTMKDADGRDIYVIKRLGSSGTDVGTLKYTVIDEQVARVDSNGMPVYKKVPTYEKDDVGSDAIAIDASGNPILGANSSAVYVWATENTNAPITSGGIPLLMYLGEDEFLGPIYVYRRNGMPEDSSAVFETLIYSDGDPIFDTVYSLGNLIPYEEELTVETYYQLNKSSGENLFPQGTRFKLIDLNSGSVYMYSVTKKSGESKIYLTGFQNAETKQYFELRDLSRDDIEKKEELDNQVAAGVITSSAAAEELEAYCSESTTTVPYKIVTARKTYEDPNAGLERFLMVVDFSNTDDPELQITLKGKSGIFIDNEAGSEDGSTTSYTIAAYYVDIQPTVTIGFRRSLKLDASTSSNIFSQSVFLSANTTLTDTRRNGYNFHTDLANGDFNYLEVVYTITDEAGNAMPIPIGTKLTIGDSVDTVTQTAGGSAFVFKSLLSPYDMEKMFAFTTMTIDGEKQYYAEDDYENVQTAADGRQYVVTSSGTLYYGTDILPVSFDDNGKAYIQASTIDSGSTVLNWVKSIDEENDRAYVSLKQLTYTGNGETISTNVSITMDFTTAIGYNFTSGTYFLDISLYRTAEPDYPLGSYPITTEKIMYTIVGSEEYGILLGIDDIDSLNINFNDVGKAKYGFKSNLSVAGMIDGASNEKVAFDLYKKNLETGLYELYIPDPGLFTVRMLFDGNFDEFDLSDGTAKSYMWKYRDGTYSTATPFEYTLTDNVSHSFKVYLTIEDLHITQILIGDVTGGKDPVYVNQVSSACSSILSRVISQNGTSGITLDTSSSEIQKTVLEEVEKVLKTARNELTVDGKGTTEIEFLVNPTEAVEAVNYKLVSRILIGDVTVASDFRIFNINRTTYNNQIN